MSSCRCNMFQRLGYCYHTGYRPKFKYVTVRELRAITRMKEYLKLVEELKR